MNRAHDLHARFPNASASFLQLNSKAPGPVVPKPSLNDMTTQSTTTLPPPKPLKQKGRLRQNADGLNKLERAFANHLRERDCGARIYEQAITLRIANGCRYTPDFITTNEWATEGWEVKGFMRDDAAVKLKVAASLYPWIKFHLVSRKKGEWQIQEILP